MKLNACHVKKSCGLGKNRIKFVGSEEKGYDLSISSNEDIGHRGIVDI